MFCPHPCRHEIIGTELHGCRSFICRPSVHNGNTTAARGLRRSSYLGPNPTAFHRVRQPPLSRSNHPHTATSHGGNIGLRWLRAPHPLLLPHKGSFSLARHSAPHGRFLDIPVTKIDSPRGEPVQPRFVLRPPQLRTTLRHILRQGHHNDFTALLEKMFASLARYHARRIGAFPFALVPPPCGYTGD